MGELELDRQELRLFLHAQIFLYGNAASEKLAGQVAKEVADLWNGPSASVKIGNEWFTLNFKINGLHVPRLNDLEIYSNTDPQKNYFRVETFAHGNISFVDGLNSNTGYFLLNNLLDNSTTAAHEFGHTLGLPHPSDIVFRGNGFPGIMYPRGSVADPQYHYDPDATPFSKGGTIHPGFRKVSLDDIAALKLHEIDFDEYGKAILGGFSAVWHDAHQA